MLKTFFATLILLATYGASASNFYIRVDGSVDRGSETMLFVQFTVPTRTGALASASSPCTGPPYTDSFAGSGALSSCWTQTTATGFVPLVRSSGVVVPNTAAHQGLAIYTGGTFTTTQQAQATLVWNTGNYSGICIQMTVAGNGACYLPYTGNVEQLVNGSGTGALVTGCTASTSGHVIKIATNPTNTVVTDVTTSTVLCTGVSITFAGTPAIYVDQATAPGDSITNFTAQ